MVPVPAAASIMAERGMDTVRRGVDGLLGLVGVHGSGRCQDVVVATRGMSSGRMVKGGSDGGEGGQLV